MKYYLYENGAISTLASEDAKQITEKEYNAIIKERDEYISKKLAEMNSKILDKATRIQALQDKAIIEGLTDDEKKEYKELRGL